MIIAPSVDSQRAERGLPCRRARFNRLATRLVVAGSLWIFQGSFVLADGQRSPTPALSQQERIAELIKQLGADDYPRRRLAARELRRMGIAALDQLLEARHHEDAEIRFQADYLLHDIRIHWVAPSDPPAVKRMMAGYQEMSEPERMLQASMVASILDEIGIPWLCRIARFDASENVSKHAVTELMSYPHLNDPDSIQRILTAIQETGVSENRTATTWLTTYARYLKQPQAVLANWKELIEQEAALVADVKDEQVQMPLVQLTKWYVAELLKRDQFDAAHDCFVEYMLNHEDRSELFSTAQWILDIGGPRLLDELKKENREFFEETSAGLYLDAEAKYKLGEGEAAEQQATKAFELGRSHVLQGNWLERRGLYDWAIREYQATLAEQKLGSPEDIRARWTLSELFHDRLRDKEAAETLDPLAAAMEKNRAIANRVGDTGRQPGAILSRMHFFWAEHHRQLAEREKQIERLKLAIEADRTDADVLIAMYRLENADPAWRKKTSLLIREATRFFEDQIRETETAPLEQFERQIQLASFHNQLAWLVGNTEGDYAAAVEHSRQSLEYRLQAAGYLDTLGRCYFAQHDLPKALRYQRLAAHLEPGSQQIRRQLQQFETAGQVTPE